MTTAYVSVAPLTKVTERYCIALRAGDTASSSTNTVEPTSMASAGVLLSRYAGMPVTKIIDGGTLVGLRLVAYGSLKNTTGAATSSAKLMARMAGSSTVRSTSAQTTVSASAIALDFELDLFPYYGDFADGHFVAGVGVWSTAGTGELGNSSLTEPNITLMLCLEVEL